jgi:opacity protein-like surface antigen
MLVALVLPVAAAAQDAPSLRARRLAVEAAATWSGRYDVGTATASLRGNGPGATPPAFTLFIADSRVDRSGGPELRLGLALTSRLGLEAAAGWADPHVGVSIRADAEAPAQQLPGERLQQYTFTGGMTWQLPIGLGRRLAPFAAAGGGYLRQLHEDRTLAEGGQIYYAGIGARYWLRGGRGASRAIGLRGDARVNLRRHGIDFEDQMRTYPTFSFALFVGL